MSSSSAQRLDIMTVDEKDRLIQDYQNGMSLKKIYNKYQINKHGCYTILDEWGIQRKRTPSFIEIPEEDFSETEDEGLDKDDILDRKYPAPRELSRIMQVHLEEL